MCGSATVFFCAELGAARESLVCAQCKATSRYRGLARGILRVFREAAGVEAESLAQLGTRGADRTMRVYDTQTPFSWAPCAYPIPEVLRSASWIELHVSSYRPDLPWGTELGPGWSNQTLELLTFADGTFDLVLTSDVMEHVRLDARARAEIARVLRVGGAYVFQVDHTRDRHETELHVRITDPDDPSADEFLVEPMYHGDANSEGAALCYRRYGTDLDDMLGALGFDVEYVREDLPAAGILHTEFFLCRKLR